MPYHRRLKRVATALAARKSSPLHRRLLQPFRRHSPLVSTAKTFQIDDLMPARAARWWGRSHSIIVGSRMMARPSSPGRGGILDDVRVRMSGKPAREVLSRGRVPEREYLQQGRARRRYLAPGAASTAKAISQKTTGSDATQRAAVSRQQSSSRCLHHRNSRFERVARSNSRRPVDDRDYRPRGYRRTLSSVITARRGRSRCCTCANVRSPVWRWRYVGFSAARRLGGCRARARGIAGADECRPMKPGGLV